MAKITKVDLRDSPLHQSRMEDLMMVTGMNSKGLWMRALDLLYEEEMSRVRKLDRLQRSIRVKDKHRVVVETVTAKTKVDPKSICLAMLEGEWDAEDMVCSFDQYSCIHANDKKVVIESSFIEVGDEEIPGDDKRIQELKYTGAIPPDRLSRYVKEMKGEPGRKLIDNIEVTIR